MHKKISFIAGLTAFFAMGSAGAQGAPACTSPLPSVVPKELKGDPLTYDNVNPETGHTYVVYKATGITWEQASCWVANLLAQGGPDIKPHLATITSSRENTWIVKELLTPVLGQFEGGRTQVWVGGLRRNPASVMQGELPWEWVNSEGRFPGVNTGAETNGVFANWAATEGEPNNQNTVENWVTLGRYAENLAGWNDEGSAVSSIGGFVVEYDTPRTANECDPATNPSGVCTTVAGQTLAFPVGSFDQSTDIIKFTAFEFNDPRVGTGTNNRCGKDTLPLFTTAQGFPAGSELLIPAYLCGSPKFVVVKVDSKDLVIKQGAVGVINDTEVVLPDNLYQCFDPKLLPLPAVLPNPEQQDVVVWQSTDPRKMLEGPTNTIPDLVGAPKGAPAGDVFFGTATEATNGCGSTTGKVRTGSYFVVGMHVEFSDDDGATDYTNFFKLTKYKLDLLMQSVRTARASGAVRNPDGQAMESQLKNAINAMNANNPASALASINKFLLKVRASQYLFPTSNLDVIAYNYQGDHLMRGENIAFTLRVKVIPFK